MDKLLATYGGLVMLALGVCAVNWLANKFWPVKNEETDEKKPMAVRVKR